jgi:hypothetical protein
MVNQLNHMWFRDVFAEPFLTLVKNIGKEETQSDVLVIHRKWLPVPVGKNSNREITRDLVVDLRVQYQQGDVKTCLFGLSTRDGASRKSNPSPGMLKSSSLENLHL